MATPFLGEIRMTSFTLIPKGWALCGGQLLPINQNQALFSLLGTFYGGNGQTNFALPDLRGRIPVHVGTGFSQGQNGGETAHVLTSAEMPVHTHTVAVASGTGSQASPTGNYWAGVRNANAFTDSPSAANANLAAGTIGNFGGGQPHDNRSPYLVIHFVIALIGIFPSRT